MKHATFSNLGHLRHSRLACLNVARGCYPRNVCLRDLRCCDLSQRASARRSSLRAPARLPRWWRTSSPTRTTPFEGSPPRAAPGLPALPRSPHPRRFPRCGAQAAAGAGAARRGAAVQRAARLPPPNRPARAATSYELRATSYELQATSYLLRATSYKLQATTVGR